MFKGLSTFFVVFLWFTAISVHAEIPEKPYYIGIHYGIANLHTGAKYHIPGAGSSPQNFNARTSKPSATTFNGGYRITDNWSVEAQYMISGILDAPFFVGNDEIFDLAELSGQSYGVYGVYQAGSDVYFRARLGVGQSFMSLTGNGIKENFSGFNVTYGVSVGQKMGKLGGVEISYMRYADVKGEDCIILEGTSCSMDGTNRFIQLNNKMKLGTITVGYVFMF